MSPTVAAGADVTAGWERIVGIGIAVAWLSVTVSDSRVFAPAREFVGRKSEFFGALVKCGYCTGFWLSLALTPLLLRDRGIPELLVSVVQVAFVGALGWASVVGLMKFAGK